jgi:hypothetical protein
MTKTWSQANTYNWEINFISWEEIPCKDAIFKEMFELGREEIKNNLSKSEIRKRIKEIYARHGIKITGKIVS